MWLCKPIYVPTMCTTHTDSLTQYCVESSINGTNLSCREFLLGRLILGLLQTETVCSIVRPHVRVYSHLALNGAITLCSRLANSDRVRCWHAAFVEGEKRGERHLLFTLKQRPTVSCSENKMTLTVYFFRREKEGLDTVCFFFLREMDMN